MPFDLSITLIIIAITCVVSFAAFNNAELMERLILWPPAVHRKRQVERLLTYGFVHADGMHLLFNMITLYFFGQVIERLYTGLAGPLGFVLFYVLGVIVSILPSYFQNRDNPNYRSLGASGAVSAVLFAYILIQPWSTIYVYFIPVPAILFAALYIIYSVVMDRRRADRVNHAAHLWGAAYGVAFTGLIEPRVLTHFLTALAHPSLGH